MGEKARKLNGIQNITASKSYEVLFSKDFINGSIAFSNWSDESTDSDDAGLSEVNSSVGVNVADVDLDWSIVFWCDKLVGVVALSGKVKIG